MATFTGTSANETITPTTLSGTVTADPPGSLPSDASDVLYGLGGQDYLDGGGGYDTIFGGDGADILYGGVGDDRLDGGTGADTMSGGSYSDTYYVDQAGDQVIEGEDPAIGGDRVVSTISYTLGTYVEYLTLAGSASISGTGNDGRNQILGNDAANVIDGKGGDDELIGYNGDDLILGGAGADALNAWSGVGVNAADGHDTLIGGTGDDVYFVADGDVAEEDAGAGYDVIYTHTNWTLGVEFEKLILDADDLRVYGNAEGNLIDARSYVGTVYGLGGDDTLRGSEGATLLGGAGDDLYVLGDGGRIVESAGGGHDEAEIHFGGYYYGDNVFVLDANVETLRVFDNEEYYYDYYSYTGGYYYIGSTVTANASANLIYGGEGSNEIFGAGGRDTIHGGSGEDSLDGGAGTDYLDGGADRDMVLYTANTTTVRVDLAAGRATFPGQSYPAETLVAIEDAATGSGNDVLIGDAGENRLYGNDGNDSFSGGGGRDLLDGGAGNDSLSGGASPDYMLGGDGNDTFDGGGGNDSAFGGAGSDTILYTVNTSPVVVDLAGQRASFPGTGWAAETFSSIENAATGSGADTLLGSSVANELHGRGGADHLTGGGGADRLVGGLGNDVFHFRAVAESIGASRDTIAAGDGAVAFQGAGAGAGDRIDVSEIDANAIAAGNQAFVWGGGHGRGHLWAVDSGNVTLVRGNVDNDAAFEIEIAIQDAGVAAHQYVAGDFIL